MDNLFQGNINTNDEGHPAVVRQILQGDTRLSDAMSDAYADIVFTILYDGLSNSFEDTFSTSKSFTCTFSDGNNGLTFSLSLSNDQGGTPALDNFVYPTNQSYNFGGRGRDIVDNQYLAEQAGFLSPMLTKHNINMDLYSFLYNYSKLVFEYTDKIINYLGMYGVTTEFQSAVSAGAFHFGGVVIYPIVQADGIDFRFELTNKLRYGLKTDIKFTSDEI